MAFKENADLETQLMPVKADIYGVSDGNIPPKIRRVSTVLSATGEPITLDLPSSWTRFIADAMNSYWENINRIGDVEGKILCSMIIGGRPQCKEDDRGVMIDDKGNIRLKRKIYYSRWINRTRQDLSRSWVKKPKELPIAQKCVVTGTFYVAPEKHPKSIGDYLSGLLDCLYQVGVLSGLGRSVVVSTDGSRVVHTTQDYRTEVVIKEIVE